MWSLLRLILFISKCKTSKVLAPIPTRAFLRKYLLSGPKISQSIYWKIQHLGDMWKLMRVCMKKRMFTLLRGGWGKINCNLLEYLIMINSCKVAAASRFLYLSHFCLRPVRIRKIRAKPPSWPNCCKYVMYGRHLSCYLIMGILLRSRAFWHSKYIPCVWNQLTASE